MVDPSLPIAVIGAGFSGTVTALHLLHQAPGRRVLLCERGPTFARGAAYSTNDPAHLLNVRASNISAFPDRPDHFVEWLSSRDDLPDEQVHDTAAGRFVSRAIYGRYLSALVESDLGRPEGAGRLMIVPDEAVSLVRRDDGAFALTLGSGRSHRVAAAVIAAGNLLTCADGEPGRIVHHPWAVRFADGLVDGRPVVVVGTGLTMVDVVTSLHGSGFAGPVFAISRHGLLPRSHVAPRSWALSRVDPAAALPLSRLVRSVRREVEDAERQGLPWQSVMDAVRPMTGALWRGLTVDGQARFLRHLRPWWDIHRHRMAPPVAEHLHGLVRAGYLRVGAGRIRAVSEAGQDGVLVRWRARGEAAEETISAQRIIYATGTPALATARDTLLDQVLRAGLARLDRHGLGLDATDDFALVGRDGSVGGGLWAIGPILRGSSWECTAVPDIRADAQRLAGAIGRALA